MTQFERYEQDRSRYRPLVNQPPRDFSARKFVVVQEEIQERKPITKEELARILTRPHANPEVVLYGQRTPLPQDQPLKNKTEVEVQGERTQRFLNCC